MMKDNLKVSIVILVYNGMDTLTKQWDALETQDSTFEKIYIDSSSTDGSYEYLVGKGEKVHQISPNDFNHGTTRNLGSEIASGDLLLFLTQDAIPAHPECVSNLKSALLSDSKHAIAYGRQLPHQGAGLFARFARQCNYPPENRIKKLEDANELGLKTPHLSNSFAMYRRSYLEEVGNFPGHTIMCEDVFAGAKSLLQGYYIAYVGNAKVFHSHDYSLSEEFKRYFDIGHFYLKEAWITNAFSGAESQGMAFVKSEFKFLMKNGGWYLFPEFIARNGLKYLGYRLGGLSHLIPIGMKRKLSMHHRFWK